MIRGRGNASYVCDNGCCSVRVEIHLKRGFPAQMWLNGQVGTFATHAAAMATTAEAVNSKIRRRSCLNARRVSKDIRVVEKSMQGLAARFLALPVVGYRAKGAEVSA